MRILDKNIRLPAVKKVTLELIPPFDIMFFRDALKTKGKDYDFVTNLNWPEAVKAMYKRVQKARNELAHIKSCCNKADENLSQFESYLWRKILAHSMAREV